MRKKINYFSTCFLLFVLTTCVSSFGNTLSEDKTNKIEIQRHFVFETIPMNLEEITTAADRIFTGTCINKEEIEEDSESGLSVIKYTFKITQGLKGTGDKEKISFKQWQPLIRGASYTLGKKYVLFLYPNSKKGLTSPVGLAQGQFDIEQRGVIRKKEVVRNKLNNKGLNRNLRTQKKITIDNSYINNYVHYCAEHGVPMRYKEFTEAVKYLVRKEK